MQGAYGRKIQRPCGKGIARDLACDSGSILVVVLKYGFVRRNWGRANYTRCLRIISHLLEFIDIISKKKLIKNQKEEEWMSHGHVISFQSFPMAVGRLF